MKVKDEHGETQFLVPGRISLSLHYGRYHYLGFGYVDFSVALRRWFLRRHAKSMALNLRR
jgi:hypothetical protein